MPNRRGKCLSYIARLPNVENELNPLIQPCGQSSAVGVLLVTADRGLAGGFNANVIRRTAAVYAGAATGGRGGGSCDGGAQGAGLAIAL